MANETNNGANGGVAKPVKDEIIMVGPGAEEDGQPENPRDNAAAAGEDYQYPNDDGAEEGGEGAGEGGEGDGREARAGHSEESDEGERGGQNLSREQKRRQRRRARYESDQRELNFLRSRNEQLERDYSRRMAEVENRQAGTEIATIDGRISQAENDVREADGLFAQAVKSSDEGAIAEALRVRDQLRDGLNNLRGMKAQAAHNARVRRSEPAAGSDPIIEQQAAQWNSRNRWYDPSDRDEDSKIAHAIERQLNSEGRFNPRTPAYWDELDRRLAKRLPEHYNTRGRDRDPNDDDEDDDVDDARDRGDRRDRGRDDRRGNGRTGGRVNGRRSGGPEIRVGGRERPLKKGEVYIDEDRKKAMIEAGIWDDPDRRERQLRAYQQYDREAGRRRH